jgi:hypothetical protein
MKAKVVVAWATVAVPIVALADEAAERRLKALTPPQEERKAVDAMRRSLRRLLGAVRARIAALDSEDRAAAVKAVNDYETAWSDVVARAGVAGISECQGLGV